MIVVIFFSGYLSLLRVPVPVSYWRSGHLRHSYTKVLPYGSVVSNNVSLSGICVSCPSLARVTDFVFCMFIDLSLLHPSFSLSSTLLPPPLSLPPLPSIPSLLSPPLPPSSSPSSHNISGTVIVSNASLFPYYNLTNATPPGDLCFGHVTQIQAYYLFLVSCRDNENENTIVF